MNMMTKESNSKKSYYLCKLIPPIYKVRVINLDHATTHEWLGFSVI